MKPISCNQETGGHRMAFVPRSPTGSCLVSVGLKSHLLEKVRDKSPGMAALFSCK